MLELREVSVRMGRELLVEGVSLEVARASIHALMGPNGAGKSTLLAAILGRVPFSGAIRCAFRGQGRGASAIGFVPQSFAVDRTLSLTVLEFLALSRQSFPPVAAAVTRLVRSRVETLLARVDLGGFGSKPLSVLSGGEMQRVLFANAIDPIPELLLLDEPASGLDAKAAERMEAILRALREEHGVTVLMVSHDAGAVERIADRVTVLNRRIQKDGAPRAVLH